LVKLRDLIKFSKQELSIRDINSEEFSKIKILLKEIFKISESDLILNNDVKLENDYLIKKYKDFLKKIKNNTPVEYLVKKKFFYKNEFFVNENVLIPRSETEILVDYCIGILKEGDRVLEIGIGSGIISISIALERDVFIDSTEISKRAIYVARKNIGRFNLKKRIRIFNTDLFPGNNKQYNLIVSNPPYIDEEELKILRKKGLKDPEFALNGGKKGLDVIERIIINAKEYLLENGKLVFEMGYNQKDDVEFLLKKYSYRNVEFLKDYNNIYRVAIGEK